MKKFSFLIFISFLVLISLAFGLDNITVSDPIIYENGSDGNHWLFLENAFDSGIGTYSYPGEGIGISVEAYFTANYSIPNYTISHVYLFYMTQEDVVNYYQVLVPEVCWNGSFSSDYVGIYVSYYGAVADDSPRLRCYSSPFGDLETLVSITNTSPVRYYEDYMVFEVINDSSNSSELLESGGGGGSSFVSSAWQGCSDSRELFAEAFELLMLDTPDFSTVGKNLVSVVSLFIRMFICHIGHMSLADIG